ncbi:RagB/SusD family nutrient uptake outer membrane protein [Arcticibacter sp. MXS-1]|uniref:RagB/SusD family nutrient uptake outer membrane protein n=1 Tax=Arcticibacter sp. MXS-1 TaxID=3341726 RepID=UPI0035A96959
MKRTLKNILGMAAVAALSLPNSGCKDFLEVTPLDTRVETNFFKSQSDVNEALVGVYDVLQWQTNAGGGGFSPDALLSDIASDDAFAGGGSRSDSPNMISIDQQNILPTNTDLPVHWGNHFTGIYRANQLLKRLPATAASDEFKKSVTAQVKFLRAYFYLDLVRFYENIPLLLEPLESGAGCVEQASPEAVYNQIATDLEEAIPDLPAKTLKDNDGRATRWAAEALLARTFLFYHGVYKKDLQAGSTAVNSQRALAHLTDLINNSGHDLLPNYADIFKKGFEFSKESVWEISFSDLNPWYDWGYIQGGEGNMQPLMQGPRIASDPNYSTGWSFAPVTQALVNAFEPNDPRKAATIISQEEDLTGKVTPGYQHTGYFSKKYTTSEEYAPTGGTYELNWGNNYRSIRFADVLLMAAELELMTGGSKAQTYLNRVRSRVGMPEKPATLPNIFQERRVELALEGQRYWDLLRQGVSVAEQAITIQNQRGPHYVGDQIDFNVKFNAARKGFFPIPQSELDQCRTLKQNAGY